MPYIPLHVHSINSPFHGMITPAELVQRASFLKLPAVAMTDRWTTFGHHEFYRIAVEAGIKPVLGAEVRHLSITGGRTLFHLTVLAENNIGYSNLISLVDKHYEKEKYPHVTEHEMILHREGLIVLSGCLSGEASQAILHGNLPRERAVVEKLIKIFGRGNVYLEIMNHNSDKEQFVIDKIIPLSRKLKVPMVATNNDRFVDKDDAKFYSHLRRLDPTDGAKLDEEIQAEFYLKKQKEMEPYFYIAGEALEESGRIAERCNVELDFSGTVDFAGSGGHWDKLAEMSERRFLLKFHSRKKPDIERLRNLMKEELSNARQKKLEGFILFLMDLIHGCTARGIGLELMSSDMLESFIAYLLDITPLNPDDHGLVFESFTSSRDGVPPQMEVLKSKGAREVFLLVLRGLLPRQKIYHQAVREEVSFNTLVRDLSESENLSSETRETLSGILGATRKKLSLHDLLDGSEQLTHIYNNNVQVREILHSANALKGRVHHFHQNMSRLVVIPESASSQISAITGTSGDTFALADNATIERVGGWILTVQRSHFLSALEGTVRIVEKREPEKVRLLSAIDSIDDKKTFELISKGDTTGVYLLESKGIRDLLEKVKPADFDELVNVISLYRPAPLEGKLWQKYIENAEKKGKVFLPHHSMAAPLENTRGLLLYREQLREILKNSARITGEKAVKIEKALINHETGDLLGARLEFIRGAMDNDIDEEKAQQVFDFLLHNIRYTYDKAFSCSQAFISYRSAYLKAHVHDEYFASLLNNTSDVKDRQKMYLDYLESINRPVFPPDINSSEMAYSMEEGGIRSPLNESNTLDRGELELIIEERKENGEFGSLEGFLDRLSTELPMSSVNLIIDAGLFDFHMIPHTELRDACLAFYEKHGRAGDFFRPPTHQVKGRKETDKGQLSLFDGEQGD